MDQNRVENQVDEGTHQIHLRNATTGIPLKGARITISYTGGPAGGRVCCDGRKRRGAF